MIKEKIESLRESRLEKSMAERVKKKDKDAFVEAYDFYVDAIYRFIFFKVGNQEDAQDLTSQVFLKSWNHILDQGLKDAKTLRPLFYAVARNAVIDFYRANSSKQNIISTDEADNSELSSNPKQEVDVDVVLVHAQLNNLKDEYREVLVLHYIEEFSVKEISQALGKSKGNVRVLIHRALKTLKELTYKAQ